MFGIDNANKSSLLFTLLTKQLTEHSRYAVPTTEAYSSSYVQQLAAKFEKQSLTIIPSIFS
jgi:hypothetical protein